MNDSKTEMMVFTSNRVKLPDLSVMVGTDSNHSAATARKLGMILDSHLSMDVHIKRVCQVSYFQLKTLRSVRDVLSVEALERLVHAFVTARLDYCNSILIRISDAPIHKLQLLQNAAARLVSKTGRYEHITPVMKALHWLPVKQRIEFKALVLTYKAPPYVCEMIQLYQPTKALRSADTNLLAVPRVRLKTFGHRSFHYASPHLWNQTSRHEKITIITHFQAPQNNAVELGCCINHTLFIII